MLGFNLALLIFAVVFLLGGAGALWWRTRIGREIQVMAATPSSTVAQALAAGPGTFVEIAGTLKCQTPIPSEFSETPCAYFRSEITREEVYYERDSDGKEQRKTRTRTIHSNTRNASCAIADDSGMIGVDFEGANVEAVQHLNRIGYPSTTQSVLNWLSNVGSSTDRYIEHILAPDIPIYVLAEVQGGNLLGKPGKGSPNKHFVISHKSEAERTKDLGSSMTWALWIGIIVLILGVVALWGAWKVGA